MSETRTSPGQEMPLDKTLESAGKTLEPAGSAPDLSLSDLYIQSCTSMRATDDISLKLLATIPFVSGVGITLLARKPTETFPAGARLLVSLFAAVVTFAIYRWERRNISNCSHYRRCAAELELYYLHGLSLSGREPPLDELPHDRSMPHGFFGPRWGKTEAEQLLYWTVIAGWLATGIYVFFI